MNTYYLICFDGDDIRDIGYLGEFLIKDEKIEKEDEENIYNQIVNSDEVMTKIFNMYYENDYDDNPFLEFLSSSERNEFHKNIVNQNNSVEEEKKIKVIVENMLNKFIKYHRDNIDKFIKTIECTEGTMYSFMITRKTKFLDKYMYKMK